MELKDLFGKVGEGIHSYRFMSLAIVDVLMTIVGAGILSYLFQFPFWLTLACLFVSGIILHRLFGVRTTIDKLLFT
uniref:Uncharacterized protein n=1 Tax=viral metagenome TaxID=1070528 RepID=A0A6C0I3Y7_9ZZZZ